MSLHDLISALVSALGTVLEEKLRQEQKCDSFPDPLSLGALGQVVHITGWTTEHHALLLPGPGTLATWAPGLLTFRVLLLLPNITLPFASTRGDSARDHPSSGPPTSAAHQSGSATSCFQGQGTDQPDQIGGRTA